MSRIITKKVLSNNMKNSIEELINVLDLNKIQCSKCKKWFKISDKNKYTNNRSIEYYEIKIFKRCLKCDKELRNNIWKKDLII